MKAENDIRLQAAINMTLTAVGPLGIRNDQEGQQQLGAILAGTFAAYEAGVRMGIENAPIETMEIAYRTRVTPELMKPLTAQGWDPWSLTEAMIPGDPRRPGDQAKPGWLVRFKRKAPAPVEGQS